MPDTSARFVLLQLGLDLKQRLIAAWEYINGFEYISECFSQVAAFLDFNHECSGVALGLRLAEQASKMILAV